MSVSLLLIQCAVCFSGCRQQCLFDPQPLSGTCRVYGMLLLFDSKANPAPLPSSFTNAQPPTCSMDHDLLRIACPLFSACFSGCEHQLQMRVCVPGKGPCLRVSVFLWVSFLCVAVRFWHLFIFSSQLECARSTFGFTLACHQGPQPVFIHGRRVYINFSTSQHVHGQCSLQHRKM